MRMIFKWHNHMSLWNLHFYSKMYFILNSNALHIFTGPFICTFENLIGKLTSLKDHKNVECSIEKSQYLRRRQLDRQCFDTLKVCYFFMSW